MDGGDQIGETPESTVLGIPVAVDGLTEERDFFHSFVGKSAYFAQDIFGRSALFRPAGGGNDAVCAEFVAAYHDPHEGLIRRGPHFRIPERIITLKAVGDLLAGGIASVEAHGEFPVVIPSDIVNQVRNLCELTRAYNQIDVGGFFEDQVLIFLCHTADDADDLIWTFSLREAKSPERTIDFMLGMLADGTGIEEYGICLGNVGSE